MCVCERESGAAPPHHPPPSPHPNHLVSPHIKPRKQTKIPADPPGVCRTNTHRVLNFSPTHSAEQNNPSRCVIIKLRLNCVEVVLIKYLPGYSDCMALSSPKEKSVWEHFLVCYFTPVHCKFSLCDVSKLQLIDAFN